MTTNNYLSLTTFIPGTKAKADEVNSNFSILKEALMTKAELQGDSTKTFYVADAKEKNNAVSKSQLDDLQTSLLGTFSKTGYRFCVRSGNTTNGEGDLFSYSNLTVTPKIGGSYSNLIFADYTGEAHTITSANPFTMQGRADGTYNVFIKPDSTIYVSANAVYKQKARPSLVDGDIWLNTSCEPLKCIKYENNVDENFLDVPIGLIKMEKGIISKLETVDFVSNGYDVTMNIMKSFIQPDYSQGVSKVWDTLYTAESDGWVALSAYCFQSEMIYFVVNSLSIIIGRDFNPYTYVVLSGFYPVSKGDIYKGTGGTAEKTITFYPTKGASICS